jgi:nucleoside-diphosphate-sugar epimerase
MEASRRVLCTGAAGFIGSHLVKALRSRGNEVWGLLGPGDEPDPKVDSGVRWVRGDICCPDTLGALRGQFDTVYHLAGLLTSVRDDRYFSVNFEGTRNLVDAVLEGGRPRRFVFASSLAAAGPAVGPSGRSDEDPCCPVSAYGRSKRMAELYLESISGRLSSTIVRLPLVYGPGSYGGLFAYFRMVRAGCCLVVGRTVATVGYVEDIVRGFIQAAACEASSGKTYVFGDSRPYRDTEIIAAIGAALRTRPLTIHIPYSIAYWGVAVVEAMAAARGGEATVRRQELDGYLKFPFWNADTSKAAREIGVQTTVPLLEGVQLAADWYRAQGAL